MLFFFLAFAAFATETAFMGGHTADRDKEDKAPQVTRGGGKGGGHSSMDVSGW